MLDTFTFIGQQVIGILIILLRVYSFVIFGRIILSWFVQPNNSIMQFLIFLTEPILAPIRKMLEPLMRRSSIPLDLSPIIAYLLISVIITILSQLF